MHRDWSSHLDHDDHSSRSWCSLQILLSRKSYDNVVWVRCQRDYLIITCIPWGSLTLNWDGYHSVSWNYNRVKTLYTHTQFRRKINAHHGPDLLLANVGSYLVKSSRAIFAASLMAPSSSFQSSLMSQQHWKVTPSSTIMAILQHGGGLDQWKHRWKELN